MSSNKNKEMIIVKAISQLSISDNVFERSEVKKIVSDLIKSQSEVEVNIAAADKAKKAVDDGWAIGNIFKGRNKELKNAQFDLGQSIGLLTKQSSDLLLFNTAISTVLVDQQGVMQQQQELLQKQATELELQNESIMGHQIKLSQQQKEISLANQGLLEAKSLTSDQAVKLIGCVKRVEAAEEKMELSNRAMEQSIISRVTACEVRSESIKGEIDEKFYSFRQEVAVNHQKLSAECNSATDSLRVNFSNFDLKLTAESEARNIAITALAEDVNQRIQGVYDLVVERDERFSSELGTTKEVISSQIASLSSSLNKYEIETAKSNKKLLYFAISALIVSVISIGISFYLSLGV